MQIAAAVLYCLFAAGIVFGYAAIKPVLVSEGAYRDACQAAQGPAASDDDNDENLDTCLEIRLNLMFTVAAVSTNVAALPIGAILDTFGPRVCGLLGSLLLAAGALLMSVAGSLRAFDGYLVGYLLLALGGPFTFISSFHLSNAFPRHSGLVLALLTGAFDASSALFLVYRLIYGATGGAFNSRAFFRAYLVVPAALLLLQLFLMPAQSYKTVGELVDQADLAAAGNSTPQPRRDDQVDEETALLDDEEREQRLQREAVAADVASLLGSAGGGRQLEAEERKNTASGVWGVMHDRTAARQVASPWFVLVCAFTIVQMTRINFFVATVRPQYAALLGSRALAARVNGFFDVALPLGGLCSIPFIGGVLDHASTLAVLATLVSCAALVGVLGVLPYLWAAYANVVLFVLYRPFYYTAVSDYCAKVFGFRTFGTVYGLIICLAGVGNFSQSALDVLFHRTFRGDPVPVDLILLAVGLVAGVALVVFVAVQVRRLGR